MKSTPYQMKHPDWPEGPFPEVSPCPWCGREKGHDLTKHVDPDLGTRSDSAPTESKWPCFFCGSKQAHGVGFPQPGSISTVPACANCEALHTFDGRASETPPNGSETKP